MLTPLEVKKQEFSRAMRGYDPAEVRSFLETISQEMERLQEIIQLQEQDLERIKTELTAFQRMERNMKEALVNAQETLKEAREGSQREAVLRRREAEIEAVQIVKDAYKRREEVL
ncbi:MAG: DivIVA domain-containing protein, partial [Crenarchaeota archaeon]|nr:DivIVA domain-containing protein [Thermoproteota archaeon]